MTNYANLHDANRNLDLKDNGGIVPPNKIDSLLPLINQDCSCYRLFARLAPTCVDQLLDILRKYEDKYSDLTAVRDALRALLRLCQELRVKDYHDYDNRFLDLRNTRVYELLNGNPKISDGADIYNLYFANLAWYAGEIAKCPFVVEIPEESEKLISNLILLADTAQGMEFRESMHINHSEHADRCRQVKAYTFDTFKNSNIFVADKSTWTIDSTIKLEPNPTTTTTK